MTADKYRDPVREMVDAKKQAAAAPQPDAGDAYTPSEPAAIPTAHVSPSTDMVRVENKTLVDRDSQQQKNSRMTVGDKLIAKGLVSRDQVEIALKVQKSRGDNSMLGAILVEMGFITESALGEILTENTGVERFDPHSSLIDPALIKQIPKDIANRYKSVPVNREDNNVYVAMTDIYNVLAIDRIQRYFPKEVKLIPLHCSESDLSSIIENYYDYELSIDGILREMEAIANQNYEELIKISSEQDGYTNPTVRLIDALLIDAIQLGASDLHFEPEDQFVRLRYRVDGRLQLVRSFHKDYWQAIVVRIKIMSQMNITESRLPQDGRITLNILGREISFRVATQPTIHGENIVMRVLDKKKALLPMAQLGFSEENIKNLQKALRRPEGIIIVTGPTGSGKSTTLYSILSFINSMDINIMTLEDPVEYQLPLIRQSNIRAGAGMDFLSGIKSLMRQDPDVIFVGEVRDNETATMALRAAMTGHQVYTSLHTNDALGAMPRLIDIGVQPRLLSGNIICVIAQRLARRLCKCKQEHKATNEECKLLGVSHDNPPMIFKHHGCDICGNTGYKGRVAISELLLVDEGLDELIAQNASYPEMARYLRKRGFLSMADDGIAKVLKGQTDLDELIDTINMTDKM